VVGAAGLEGHQDSLRFVSQAWRELRIAELSGDELDDAIRAMYGRLERTIGAGPLAQARQMVARSHIERDARALLGLPEPRRVAGVAVAWGPASWPTSRRARELYFNAVKLVAIELDNERTAGEIE